MKKITDYAELVKAKHALNKTIAPVEDGANIAGSYTSGKQFIREGVLYTALTTIAENTAWSSLTLDTDYELADDLTSQLASLNQTLTQQLALEVDTRKRLNVDNLGETTLSGSGTVVNASYVVNSDKSITVTVNSTLSETISIPIVNNWNGFDISEYIGEKLIVSGYHDDFKLHAIIYDSSDQVLVSVVVPDNGNTITVPSGAKKCVFLLSLAAGITAGTTYTYYPRLSVAMTNQELTSKLQAKKYTHLAEVFTLGYVTAVGGDTRSSMLDKLYADAASRLAAVSNDSFFVETIRLVISDGTRAIAPMGLLNKTSTFPELNFIDSSIDASTGSVIHEVWNMKSSGSKQSSAVIRSDGPTLYSNDSVPVNVGVTYSLYAQRYIANDAVLS